MLTDLRLALRSLRQAPTFSLTVLATLALGIAANTAIFSLVYGIWLKPLPFRQPDRLALVQVRIPSLVQAPIPFSPPDVDELARLSRTLTDVNAYRAGTADLASGGQAVRVATTRITAGLFPSLGLTPALGRLFTSDDDRNRVPVLLLSHDLWQRQFGSDPNVIGRTVKLDRLPYQIAGVMPRRVQFPEPSMEGAASTDLWLPMSWTPEELANQGDAFNNTVIARLRPGVTWQQARADIDRAVDTIHKNYRTGLPASIPMLGAVTPLDEHVVQDSRSMLSTLMGAVALLLLIACANVANLLLIRGLSRQRDLALRHSLGATPARLTRQLLAECLILGLAGGAAGLLLASASLDALVRFAPANLPRLASVSIDQPVLLFTTAASLAATLLFGLLPSLSASRPDALAVLRTGSSASLGTRARTLLGNSFVAAQVALAVVLLTGAGLVMRTFLSLRSTDGGFHTNRILTASVALPKQRYTRPADMEAFREQLLARLSADPSIELASFATSLPINIGWQRLFAVENAAKSSSEKPVCAHTVVSDAFFPALGIPLLAGRNFSLQDRRGAEESVIVSQSLARRYFANGDAVGHRLKWGTASNAQPWLKVVGVVADVKNRGFDQEPLAQTYTYWRQETVALESDIKLVLRTRARPEAATSALRRAVSSLDPELAVASISTLDDVVGETLDSRRFNMYLFSVFALAATLLAALGLFGVLSHLVAQRTREIGLRKALGATAPAVLRLILRRGFSLVAAGLLAGLAAALAASRLLENLIYGVRPNDPLTLAAVCAVLLLAALAACAVPALRALRIDPMRALRWE